MQNNFSNKIKQKYPMAWILFGTYYYNKLQYFTLSKKNRIAVKARNTGICGIFQQDIKELNY